MSYTNLERLEKCVGAKMLVDLTDRSDPRTNAVDQDIVDQAIASAAAKIDAHLHVKYALPLAEVPTVVADIADALAIYDLHIYTPSDKIVADHKQALADLKSISLGTMALQVAGIEAPTQTGTGARVVDRKRPLTAAKMTGYI